MATGVGTPDDDTCVNAEPPVLLPIIEEMEAWGTELLKLVLVVSIVVPTVLLTLVVVVVVNADPCETALVASVVGVAIGLVTIATGSEAVKSICPGSRSGVTDAIVSPLLTGGCAVLPCEILLVVSPGGKLGTGADPPMSAIELDAVRLAMASGVASPETRASVVLRDCPILLVLRDCPILLVLGRLGSVTPGATPWVPNCPILPEPSQPLVPCPPSNEKLPSNPGVCSPLAF